MSSKICAMTQRGGGEGGGEAEAADGGDSGFSKFSRIMCRVITIDESKGHSITGDSKRLERDNERQRGDVMNSLRL